MRMKPKVAIQLGIRACVSIFLKMCMETDNIIFVTKVIFKIALYLKSTLLIVNNINLKTTIMDLIRVCYMVQTPNNT